MIVALITMSLATLRTVLYEKKARMLRQGRLRRRSLVATTLFFIRNQALILAKT